MARGQGASVLEFLERFQAEPRLRQRVGALGGVSLFFATGLVVAGFGRVVLAVVGLAVLGCVFALMPWSVTRGVSRRIRRAFPSEQTWQRLSERCTHWVTRVWRASLQAVRLTGAHASAAATRGRRAWNARETRPATRPIPPPTAEQLSGWPYAGSDEVAPTPSRPEPALDEQRRRAVELNTHGIDLRRSGSPAAAAALHLEALEILESLHDQRAQAPTLNSLALALAANGETDAAVERFEQSLAILRDRPADPGQGEVIANLGFTLLRQGDDTHGRELLAEALEKLPPESTAAKKVEAQLRHAS